MKRPSIIALLTVFVTGVISALVLHRLPTHAQTAKHDLSVAYELADGPYAVETLDQTIHDARRQKDLPVRILVPTSGTHFPLILFSHGAGGSGQNYFSLTHHWASYGYVVIQPTHNDSIALRREQGQPLPAGPRELIEEYRFNYEDWINRVKDVTLVIDSLGDLQKRLPQLKGKIDAKRIGIGGHSYGAFTTQMISGATLDIPNQPKAQSFADDRPRAFLLLSPQGKSQNGLTESSWKNVRRPMMSMSGTKDAGLMGQLANWRKDPFAYSPPPDKYLVWIDGAFHMSFTGALAGGQNNQGARRILISRATQGTDQKAVFDYVKIASIAFWDAYLKDDAKAKAYLKSTSLSDFSNDDVRLERK